MEGKSHNRPLFYKINMNTIHLDNVLPHVFSQQQGDLQSEVWLSDLKLEKGKKYLIEAQSGKGKSTFCSYLLGYRRDYSGSLKFDDVDTMTYRVSDWISVRRNHISMLFQELRLFPELTALENVQIKNRITQHTDLQTILSWFERLGIADKVDSKVGLMSFGQQQRVAMMRALVQPFDFIVADEPISHLDDHNSDIMAQLMLEEAGKQGAAVVVTSIGKHMKIDYDRVVLL